MEKSLNQDKYETFLSKSVLIKKKKRNFQAFEVFTFEKYVGLWFQEIFCLPKLKKI